MLSLTIINSDHIHSSFRLNSSPGASYRIGRSPECDVSLPNEIHLSRVHCILTIEEGYILLTDNNSSNGIYENEARVSQIRVRPGAVYGIGNCTLRIDYLRESPPADYRESRSRYRDDSYYDDDRRHRDSRDRYYDERDREHRHHRDSRDRDYYDHERDYRSHRDSRDRDYYDEERDYRSYRDSRDRDYYDEEREHRHPRDSRRHDYYDDERERRHSRDSRRHDYYDDERERRHSRDSRDHDYYDEQRERSYSRDSRRHDYYDEEPERRHRDSRDRDYYEEPREPRRHSERVHPQEQYREPAPTPAEARIITSPREERRDSRPEPPQAAYPAPRAEREVGIRLPSLPPGASAPKQQQTGERALEPPPPLTMPKLDSRRAPAMPAAPEQAPPEPPQEKTAATKASAPKSNTPKLRVPKPKAADTGKKKKKFVPPPPRKALVERAVPRPFYTAAGKLNTETNTPQPKELKHRKDRGIGNVKRAPSEPATVIGLPNDFNLSVRLLNTTDTLEDGDILRFGIIAEEACHVYLLQYDSENNGVMLVPGVGGVLNHIKAAQMTQFPPAGDNSTYELYVEEPYGTDTIIAIACTKASKFVKLWDTIISQADSMSYIGELEKHTISQCMQEKDMADAKWASAILYLKTGPASS